MPGFNISLGEEDGPPNTIETVRSHRYKLTVLEPMQPVLLYAYKCQRPTIEADRLVMHQGQDELYLPGKSRWLPIEITFYEVIDEYDLVAEYLQQWMLEAMIKPQESELGRAQDYKKRCELQLEDGAGSPVWLYKLLDVWPSKVVPSELNYSTAEIAEITVTLELGKVLQERQVSQARDTVSKSVCTGAE